MAQFGEYEALIAATNNLRRAKQFVDRAVLTCQQYAPGWAGEVESVRDAIDETVANFRDALNVVKGE